MDSKKKFGQTLREHREKLSKSLIDIENETSIKLSYLEAIEGGRLDKIVAPVYARGFTKQYANFLGLDGERLLREEQIFFKGPDNKPYFSYGISTVETRGSQMPSSQLWTYVMRAVLGMTLFSIFWYLSRHFGWF